MIGYIDPCLFDAHVWIRTIQMSISFDTLLVLITYASHSWEAQ